MFQRLFLGFTHVVVDLSRCFKVDFGIMTFYGMLLSIISRFSFQRDGYENWELFFDVTILFLNGAVSDLVIS